MSKKEFIEAYASKVGESKKRSEELVGAFLTLVEEKLVKGESIQFVGWGTFDTHERPARNGINPATKETIKIPAKKVVKFKPGKKLTDKISGK